MYNDTYMTITGNVVDEPRLRSTKSGHSVTNLRIASTSRRHDRELGRWVDNATLFVNVTCWRAMAENVAASLHKGQPVVVTGRYYSREYEVAESKRVGYELEAIAIGHDLSRGTGEFRRQYRPSGGVQVPVDENGVPVDDSDRWLDLNTGEVTASPSETEADGGRDGVLGAVAGEPAAEFDAESREFVNAG